MPFTATYKVCVFSCSGSPPTEIYTGVDLYNWVGLPGWVGVKGTQFYFTPTVPSLADWGVKGPSYDNPVSKYHGPDIQIYSDISNQPKIY